MEKEQKRHSEIIEVRKVVPHFTDPEEVFVSELTIIDTGGRERRITDPNCMKTPGLSKVGPGTRLKITEERVITGIKILEPEAAKIV